MTTVIDVLDLITHAPDGESRGLMFREGDVFPMSPAGHILSNPAAPATEARPWGLRYLRVPRPRAGAHEGATNDTSANSDGAKAEETSSD